MSKIKRKWALVTGASSGLGVDFATILAEHGCNVVLVARREDRLKALADTLKDRHKIETRVIAMDLGTSTAARELYEKTKAEGLEIDVLINNAGFGIHADFMETEWERTAQMLQLNLTTLTELTYLYTKDMLARDFGFNLLVSSIGGFQPTPSYAAYAATKSYVLDFGEALAHELRDTNVGVTVLAPGGTRTEFMEVAGQEIAGIVNLAMMESRRCASIGIKAMLKKKPSVVPGLLNKIATFSVRLAPRRVVPAIAGFVMK